jgi:hypothetical protein
LLKNGTSYQDMLVTWYLCAILSCSFTAYHSAGRLGHNFVTALFLFVVTTNVCFIVLLGSNDSICIATLAQHRSTYGTVVTSVLGFNERRGISWLADEILTSKGLCPVTLVDLLIMRISILLKQCSSCLCSWDTVPRLWVTDPRRFETMYWFHLKKSSAQTLNLFCSACQSILAFRFKFIKIDVKFALEQITKAQKGSRVIVLLFL